MHTGGSALSPRRVPPSLCCSQGLSPERPVQCPALCQGTLSSLAQPHAGHWAGSGSPWAPSVLAVSSALAWGGCALALLGSVAWREDPAEPSWALAGCQHPSCSCEASSPCGALDIMDQVLRLLEVGPGAEHCPQGSSTAASKLGGSQGASSAWQCPWPPPAVLCPGSPQSLNVQGSQAPPPQRSATSGLILGVPPRSRLLPACWAPVWCLCAHCRLTRSPPGSDPSSLCASSQQATPVRALFN